jgi:hypothetical protein
MNRPLARGIAAAALSALTLASCGGSTPSTPSPNPVTDTFTGTLGPGGRGIHPFTSQVGTVTTTLAALSGADYVGVGIGTWDGTTCTMVFHTENVVVNAQFLTAVPAAQNMCVMIYDVGRITTTASYTLTVVHP